MESDDPPSPPFKIAVYQRVINIYHFRLLSAWRCVFPSESIPPGREHPPCIDDWSRETMEKVLINYRNHLSWFKRGDSPGIVSLDGSWEMKVEDFLVAYAGRFKNDTRDLEECLEFLEVGGLHQQTTRMRWVWREPWDRM
ncbi:hypothetical protein EDC01DRAFT_782636 [Geopyxis carbonaria]|nr:hypothetical protein EDC01DRAFT_782636 [Geopyxis carbonaria]